MSFKDKEFLLIYLPFFYDDNHYQVNSFRHHQNLHDSQSKTLFFLDFSEICDFDLLILFSLCFSLPLNLLCLPLLSTARSMHPLFLFSFSFHFLVPNSLPTLKEEFNVFILVSYCWTCPEQAFVYSHII